MAHRIKSFLKVKENYVRDMFTLDIQSPIFQAIKQIAGHRPALDKDMLTFGNKTAVQQVAQECVIHNSLHNSTARGSEIN